MEYMYFNIDPVRQLKKSIKSILNAHHDITVHEIQLAQTAVYFICKKGMHHYVIPNALIETLSKFIKEQIHAKFEFPIIEKNTINLIDYVCTEYTKIICRSCGTCHESNVFIKNTIENLRNNWARVMCISELLPHEIIMEIFDRLHPKEYTQHCEHSDPIKK
jgi:hypothetical protein